MDTFFTIADDEQKIAIFTFLSEAKIVVSFDFDQEKAHAHFSKHHPECYPSHLVNNAKEVRLTGLLHENPTVDSITVTKAEYRSGDSDTSYDDSAYVKHTTPANPDGMILSMPLSIITSLRMVSLRLA